MNHLTKSFIYLILITLASCHSLDLPADTPSCVENKIQEIRNKPVTNPPTTVEQWNVDGQTYYYFTSDCCDQYNYLYDESCNQICAPDGGFTGEGDGNCPDFTGEIEKIVIWKDDRG